MHACGACENSAYFILSYTAILKSLLGSYMAGRLHQLLPPLGPEPRSGYFPAYQAETAHEPELQPMANGWRENYSPRRAGRCHRSDARHAPARGRDHEANFFFNATGTPQIYTLSLHDALDLLL